jgi:hypothetical protein
MKRWQRWGLVASGFFVLLEAFLRALRLIWWCQEASRPCRTCCGGSLRIAQLGQCLPEIPQIVKAWTRVDRGRRIPS